PVFRGGAQRRRAGRSVGGARYPRITCRQGHQLARAVVKLRLAAGFTFCHECGERINLTSAEPFGQPTEEQIEATEVDRRVADERSRFEAAVFRLTTYVRREGPTCFISYATGDPAQERWVEQTLAQDLAKAGVRVILDRWELRPGSSLPRFIERVHHADRVIVVGTPTYQTKYLNGDPMRGTGVGAEGDLIGFRMIGTEEQKASVLPVLVAGEPATSFPPLLQSRIYADFRDPDAYFVTAFDLMLTLYGIDPREPAVADLRRDIAGPLP
ncbi:MAG: toll/interleukin-1 receptor domain-containing protein, partial [Micromonosporaceae bacterium]|nr:toll/interleukin-1 receptor domain-containing protein [Micromonosporaceae bacterium]